MKTLEYWENEIARLCKLQELADWGAKEKHNYFENEIREAIRRRDSVEAKLRKL